MAASNLNPDPSANAEPAADAPHPDAAPALVDRMGIINRIQSALRSTLNVEDVRSIIMATLISREGFDFSRAMLLAYDASLGRLSGLGALGPIDRRQSERLENEIRFEEKTLAGMVRCLNELEPRSGEEEALFRRSLADLSSHSFWVTTHQIYSSANELSEAIRQIQFPFIEEDSEDPSSGARLVHQALAGPSARIFKHAELAATDLPKKLLAILEGDSLWLPLKTQKGLRLFVIADRAFRRNELGTADLMLMDWFAGQAAMGLEIAEMYQDLDQAYHELQDLDRMKSNFLATVSHELRTPLTAINGYLQLILGNKIGAISHGQREVLERVIEHSELLTGKVNDLIEIAELDMGDDTPMALESVDPLGAMIAVLPRVETRRSRKRMTIEPMVEDAIPRIRAGAQPLERIFFHLLDNALKFGREGGRVRVEFRETGGEMAISVIDNGIGISQNQLQSIFTAFYQVDNQLTRSYEGLGIGLTVTKRQLDRTGGRIEVQSDPGQGSTFTIIYPLA